MSTDFDFEKSNREITASLEKLGLMNEISKAEGKYCHALTVIIGKSVDALLAKDYDKAMEYCEILGEMLK